MTSTIELSMIVKDGAATLARCLASVTPFVDRIVIGDTGSTDETPEMGRRFGAEVLTIPWEDDFALARNQVLEQRRCDWILVLDADEMLERSAGAEIRELVKERSVCAYDNWRWNYVRDRNARLGFQPALPNPVVIEEARPWPAYILALTTRLFRNHPGIYYEGCVHETVKRRLEALHLPTRRAQFIVHDFGLAEQSEAQRERKNQFYCALGRRKLAAQPQDAQAWLELGVDELEYGRRPAEALSYVERACGLYPRYAMAWLYAGICLVRLGRHAEALERLARAADLGLRNAVFHQTVGDAHFHSGQFAEARDAYAQGGGSPLSAAKLGAAEVRLGETEEGIRHMQKAVASDPQFAELYDILAAGALLGGNPRLAADTAEARLGVGKARPAHFAFAAKLRAELGEHAAAHAILERGRAAGAELPATAQN
jgi:tetratricopeptide (TPR) repeat protein